LIAVRVYIDDDDGILVVVKDYDIDVTVIDDVALEGESEFS